MVYYNGKKILSSVKFKGDSNVTLQEKTITENGEYTADNGYAGFSKVIVNVSGAGSEFSLAKMVTDIIGDKYDISANDLAGLTGIRADAFRGSINMNSIGIPSTVTKIGSSAFNSCTNLSKVYITDIEAWLNIEFKDNASNPLYTAKYLYLNNEELKELVIPDGVEKISASAFYNCLSLTSVVMGDSVTEICLNAFYNCSNLASVVIGDSVTKIGIYAFYGCTSLTSLEIPDSVTEIPNYMCRDCDGLTSVVIGDSVTKIGSYAFYNCNRLESVVMGNSVSTIGSQAFYCCSSLKEVVFNSSISSISTNAFYSSSSLKRLDMSANTSIPTVSANSFSGSVPDDFQIKVPANLIDEWKVTGNWTSYADKLVTEFTNEV